MYVTREEQNTKIEPVIIWSGVNQNSMRKPVLYVTLDLHECSAPIDNRRTEMTGLLFVINHHRENKAGKKLTNLFVIVIPHHYTTQFQA